MTAFDALKDGYGQKVADAIWDHWTSGARDKFVGNGAWLDITQSAMRESLTDTMLEVIAFYMTPNVARHDDGTLCHCWYVEVWGDKAEVSE